MAINRIQTIPSAGRKYDIDYVNWESGGIEGEGLFTFGERSKKTTGVIKAVNKYIKILLTEFGSDPLSPTLGTQFMDLQYRGADSQEDLTVFVRMQLDAALDQIKFIQTQENSPDDESIASVTLSRVLKLSSETCKIYIRILTNSGVTVTVQVPNIGG